ncbi:lipid A biosynthesis lauroyl acyltransferase [Silanimonas sp.]|jgi:KDO2-lipid IV(A) lauroyltransferase|uniref:LpxL/LpxP family acyltransferase n=1 Tax=Silanimonas sp. TaxID=1929290 RepID=UPI0022BDA242|nr:lipid A biosynthesis lauroyl acyltransferase [Silanimonas sp.]MCZ8061660.1 lipid A biosynthesis lauroyl acyltransferase [Silanimonas sp.]MCZ8115175.1 lipid A biosynthesis lauroyl acyltransferase [Silanimonas sp.]
MNASLPVRLLRALAWAAALPGRRARRGLARGFAALEAARRTKRARIVATNLRLAGLDGRVSVREALGNTMLTALESLRFWTHPPRDNLRQIADVVGAEHLTAALERGGVLVVAPHQGNWELLVQWLATQGPFSLLYTRGEGPVGDAFLRLARERGGVRAVPADAHGMKPLLKALQRGELVGITPDQVPSGGGVWAPFFGTPALTMTLIHRLADRSGAAQVLAAAERRADGRFRIVVEPLAPDPGDASPEARATALNTAVEAFVRRAPAQYQWTYKRFKGDHPERGLLNPYWPECY